MSTILDTNEKVVVKIDAKMGATGNLLKLAEKVAPCLGEYNYIIGIQPVRLPEVICYGTRDVDKEVLLGISLSDRDRRRYLELLMNKETSQYEISRNDFNLTEVPELELLVYRSDSR
jgi:hypothetical protein